MSRQAKRRPSRWRCDDCGGQRRLRVNGGCYDCAFDRRTPYQRACDASILVPNGSTSTFTARDSWRGRTDESGGLAAYYSGEFFRACEFCGVGTPVDGILCANCLPRCVPVPEAHFREPDVSDVSRVLAEIGAKL